MFPRTSLPAPYVHCELVILEDDAVSVGATSISFFQCGRNTASVYFNIWIFFLSDVI